ncbi:hypothetical protein PGB90_000614 [Kerria lacca]
MATKYVVVYGGKGALGSTCISAFKSINWWVGNIATSPIEAADANILVNKENSLEDQKTSVLEQLQSVLGKNKLDFVLCVAGGWTGGNVSSKNFAKNCELMWKQSVITSIVAVSISVQFLKCGGLLVLSGASAALEPTPGMVAYGMAKASVHHLTKSLSTSDSGLPSDCTAVAILPQILDTPMNRKWIPNADTSSWTPLNFISNLFIKWCNNEDRPQSGSLVKFTTKNNVTDITFH